MDKQKPRVAVLVPARDSVDVFWAYDYMQLIVTAVLQGITIYPWLQTGASLSRQREGLVDLALASDATHLLWLDADMRFPKDTLTRLLAHDVPAVCASYTARAAPYLSLAYTDPGDWSKRVWPTADATGLRKIIACGFGCVLFQRWVFETIEKPRFLMPWIGPEGGGYMQEDLFFFLKMAEAGIPLELDQDLTKDIAHAGRFEFTAEHAVQAAQQRGDI
jgi:hypothetical protein